MEEEQRQTKRERGKREEEEDESEAMVVPMEGERGKRGGGGRGRGAGQGSGVDDEWLWSDDSDLLDVVKQSDHLKFLNIDIVAIQPLLQSQHEVIHDFEMLGVESHGRGGRR